MQRSNTGLVRCGSHRIVPLHKHQTTPPRSHTNSPGLINPQEDIVAFSLAPRDLRIHVCERAVSWERHHSSPSQSRPTPQPNTQTKRQPKHPLDPMTLLTFTTPSGDTICEEFPEHTIAQIDNSRCLDCKLDMSPAAAKDLQGDIVTGVVGNPTTFERKPFVQDDVDLMLSNAGTARANIAASVEAATGTQKDNHARRHKDRTVLQQHCDFFDTDQDGIIWPLDTYRGFHSLGFGIMLSILSLLIIHLNFSYPTLPPGHYLPDPLCRIHTRRIHKDKHGSDSGTYDNEGRFLPQKFEDIFAKYAGTDGGDKSGITFWEIVSYLQGQRVVFDFFGWGGAVFEWGATWILLWPEDGRMKKDDIRRVYDGSLFYEIAERNARMKSRRE